MPALLSLILLLSCGGDEDSATQETGTTATSEPGDSGTTAEENTPPTCAITSPEDGAFAQEGASVTLLGVVTDAEQTAPSLTVTWESDKHGGRATALASSDGEVALVTDELSADSHVISLIATDDSGELCSDFVLFTVGEPPVATITGPAPGLTVDEGETVDFTARVSDDVTEAVDLVVSWTSSLDGELSTEGADTSGDVGFSHDALSPGEHQVSLTVTDGDGLSAIDSLTLTVNGLPSAPTVTLTPEDPDTTDALVASLDTESVDPEGDPVTYAYAWSLFGAASTASDDARLPAEATIRGDVWTVTVTPGDGDGEGEAGEASVTIGNALPGLSGATITPNPASAEDTLTCTVEGFFDADDDADASTFAWSLEGSVIGTSATLSGGFGGDDTVTCEVTPHDGLDAGTAVTAVVTIGNTAPSVAVVQISPDPATVADTLSCSWAGYSDPDGDADASLVAWSVNGSSAGSGTTLSSGFVGADEVTCTVTPFDGASTGTPVDTSLTVTNSVPSLGAATITPDPATASDTLVCTATGWSDADGHADLSTWAWTVNGADVGETGPGLSTGYVAGDLVGCEVTPDDGTDTGTPVSDSLVIDNAAPSVSDVAIDPDPAIAGDALTCSWTWSDPDGDADASTVVWELDGSAVGTATTLSTSLVRGDLVTCTVTPSDGTDTGTPASSSLVVSNAPPSAASATILPSEAVVGDTLTCSWSGFSDPDGDSDASLVLWSVGGVAMSSSTSLSSGFVGGDTVTCDVTPYDGTDTGSDVSDSLVVSNTPPVIGGATITPDPAGVDDTLTCTPVSVSDADGTSSFTYDISWSVESLSAGSGTTLAGAFSRDDGVTCTVTPHDGEDDGNTVTSSELVISNTAPVVDSVSLSPSSVATEDTLEAVVSTSDADGDSVTLSFAWSVDGSVVSTAGDTLDGASWFDKGEVVVVEVTPDDGSDAGDALASSGVTVSNTAPSAATVSIDPAEPGEGTDDLVCVVDDESTDLDGDDVSYTFVWDVDGSEFGSDTGSSGPTTSHHVGDTVPGSETVAGEEWTCTVTPDDGDDDGPDASDSVTVISGVFTFSTSQVIDGATVTCSGVTNTSSYTQCDDHLADGLYFPNGITCGPTWSSTNSSYSDTQGYCQSLTGSSTFEVYYTCASSITRATWYSNSWGTTSDNGYTQHVRCYY